MNMQNNKNEKQPQTGGKVTNVENILDDWSKVTSGSLSYYSKIIDGYAISEQTKQFLGCIAVLNDFKCLMCDAIVSMLGYDKGEEKFNECYFIKLGEIESLTYDLLCHSINEKLHSKTVTEI
jgi:hypothetical protein